MKVQGVDVSHYQGSVDWARVRSAGYTFAIAKATEGLNTVDSRFADNWKGIREAGLVRGAYHFFHPTEGAAAQAAHFLSQVTLSSGDLAPALDVEISEDVAASSIEEGVKEWLDEVEAAVGVRPMIYGSPSFLTSNLASGFGDYPLWLAEYTETTPSAPAEWSKWAIWQRSQKGQVAGIEGAVDLDDFQGSEDEWASLLKT